MRAEGEKGENARKNIGKKSSCGHRYCGEIVENCDIGGGGFFRQVLGVNNNLALHTNHRKKFHPPALSADLLCALAVCLVPLIPFSGLAPLALLPVYVEVDGQTPPPGSH